MRGEYMVKKGVTLVEVLIGIFILSLIALFFFSGVAGQYRLIAATSQRSEDLFRVSGEIEDRVDKLKEAFGSGGSIPIPPNPVPPGHLETRVQVTLFALTPHERKVWVHKIDRVIGENSPTNLGQQNKNTLELWIAE